MASQVVSFDFLACKIAAVISCFVIISCQLTIVCD
jgi:hypothetical protein